ncbi:MAG: MFS transporter [Pseudomonadota bacterium]
MSADPNRLAKRNAVTLGLAGSFVQGTAPICISLGGLAGVYLLGDSSPYVTAPVTSYNVGVALGALPAAMLMRKVGRRYGFMSGSMVGLMAAGVATLGLFQANIFIFCLGLAMFGINGSFAQQYRFAAADEGTADFKPKAISWVLAGGILAAIIGPQTAIYFKDMFLPVEFAGAFFAGGFLAIIGMIILSFLKFEKPQKPDPEVVEDTGRPLSVIMAQPKFIVALLCAVGSYSLMSFVMTGAPLAMVACGISTENATLGIQWHVMAMFGPSFFTGNLIARFGKERIVATGLLLLVVCAIVSLSGLELWRFWLALVLLGVGWNFGFIGATAMLTETYEPNEKSKAQGAHDFVLFTSVAIGSLMSGITLNAYGWEMINYVVFPAVGLCLAGLLWLNLQQRSKKAV